MTHHPNLVEWRLQHGSECHLCPLNGQRKVGTDGPLNAEHIGLAEAPGKDEAEQGSTRGQLYGRPLIGASGYFFKLEHLVPAGLARLVPVVGRAWPRVDLTNVFLLNVIMCRPPKNKINSPEGRAAVRCCANSARAVLRERLAENPNRMITWMGRTALDLLKGVAGKRGKNVKKYAVDAYRGRFETDNAELAERVGGGHIDLAQTLVDEPIMSIAKATKKFWVLPEWFPAFEAWLKSFIKFYRKVERHVAKHGMTAPAAWNTKRALAWDGSDPWTEEVDNRVVCVTNHALILDILLKKQRAAMRKKVKNV